MTLERIVSVDADVFIIPNKFKIMTDKTTYLRNYFKKVTKLNSIPTVNKVIEVWFITPWCDDLSLGFDLEINGRNYFIASAELTEVPYEIFIDCKEGDVIRYLAPMKATDTNTGKDENIILEINATCKQKGYRYGSLGTFEEVLHNTTTEVKKEPDDSNNKKEIKKTKRGNLKMECKNIAINADVFVIPNIAGVVKEYNSDIHKEYFAELSRLNNIPINDNDKIVELWFSNHLELKSDNLNDHGFIVLSEGSRIQISAHNLMFVPAAMFVGVTEGDKLVFKAPAIGHILDETNEGSCERFPVILEITMTCSQSKYRYARFGKFEEVINKVTSIGTGYDEKMANGLKDALDATDAISDQYKNIGKSEEDDNKKGKSMMKNVKEKWNNLPKSVKTGVKIVAAVAVVAAVAYAGNEGYKKYIKKDENLLNGSEVVVVDETADVVVVDETIDDDVVVIND